MPGGLEIEGVGKWRGLKLQGLLYVCCPHLTFHTMVTFDEISVRYAVLQFCWQVRFSIVTVVSIV